MIEYIIYKHKDHPLTYDSGELKDLPENIISLLKEWGVKYSDKVIVASENNIIVGFFRYDLGKKRPWLYAAGTYVIPKYRNKNIAFTLWDKALRAEEPNKIFAHIASDDGLKLIKRIKKHNSSIEFELSFDDKVNAA